jgi:hypothetical protein
MSSSGHIANHVREPRCLKGGKKKPLSFLYSGFIRKFENTNDKVFLKKTIYSKLIPSSWLSEICSLNTALLRKTGKTPTFLQLYMFNRDATLAGQIYGKLS